MPFSPGAANPACAYLTLDSAGCISSFDRGAEILFGYRAAQIVGRPFGHLLANGDESTPPDGEPDVLTGLRVDGGMFPLRASVAGFAPGRTKLLLRDTSGEDRANEQACGRCDRLRPALSRIAELIVGEGSRSDSTAPRATKTVKGPEAFDPGGREQLLVDICRTLVGQVGYRSAWIGSHDAEEHRTARSAHGAQDPVATDENRPEDQSFAGIASRENLVCLTNNFATPDSSNAVPVAPAAFPIVLRGRSWGTLTVSAAAPGRFGGDEVALLRKAAEYIGFALQNSPLEPTPLSRALIDNLPGAAFVCDTRGRLIVWNGEFESVSGCTREQVARRRPFHFFSPEEMASAKQAVAAAGTEATHTSIASLRAGTFVCKWLPGDSGFLWTAVAVAGRDQSAEALFRLGAIVDSPDDAIVGKAKDGIITSWNPAAEKFFGYRAADAVGQSASMPFRAELVEEEADFPARIGRDEKVRHFDTMRVGKDGMEVEVSVMIPPVTDQTCAIVGASGIARDITEQKRAARGFRASEIPYHKIFDTARDGILIVDAETGRIVDANPAIGQMLGISYPDLLGKVLWETPAFAAAGNCRAWFEQLRDGGGRAYENLPVETAPGNLLNVEFSGLLCLGENRKTLQLHIRNTTARRQAEAGLPEGERRFRTMVDFIPQMAWIARPDGSIFWYNQRWFDYTGGTPEQMEGWGWQRVHDPAVLPRVLENWKRALAAEQPFEMEFPLRGADGRFRNFLNRAMPLRNASGKTELWFGTNTDITAQKETEESLRESEIRFSTAFRASPVALVIIRRGDGVYVDCNDTFEKLTGYGREELLGNTTTGLRLVSDDERKNFVPPFDNKDATIRTKDGRLRQVLASVRMITLHGEPHLLSCSIDITDRKQAEQEVLRLNAELEQRVAQRAEQLEMSIRELDAFSYSVSHDLRAPLRAVNGLAGIMLEDFGAQLPDEARKYLNRIRTNGKQMGCLIDDLLSFSRLSRKSVERRSVDMQAMVESVLEELTADTESGQLRIERGELPPCCGDAALLRQVWINLLSNAIKYSRDRLPAVVEIGCQRKGAEDVFFVRDNGAGFDMAYSGKLFGVFQRLHRADEFEGTGVGLAIVQSIVNRHGGRVWAEAKLDCGATFFFTLGAQPA
jgi:PAS domain S-box-containing protein